MNTDQIAAESASKILISFCEICDVRVPISQLPKCKNAMENSEAIIKSAIEKATEGMISKEFVKAQLLKQRTTKQHTVTLEALDKLWRSGEAEMQSAHASETTSSPTEQQQRKKPNE